jgi:hypothetical protein
MIAIERNNNSFVLKVHDKGFGTYAQSAKDLESALTGVRHYYGREHDKQECPMCAGERSESQ